MTAKKAMRIMATMVILVLMSFSDTSARSSCTECFIYLPAVLLSDAVPTIIHSPAFDAPIVQQPEGDGLYVSLLPDVVTQFSLADHYGTIGLLAHAHLMGQYFPLLKTGDIVSVKYGNGASVDEYNIVSIARYQKIGENLYQDVEGKQIIGAELFVKHYTNGGIVLQTCIESDNDPQWGILFVVGESP